MNSYSKILFIILVAFLLPHFVFAQNQDYLSIEGKLLNNQISIDIVEQRVFKSSDVPIYSSGSYETRIYRGGKLVNNNFFEIVENSKLRIDMGNNIEEVFPSNLSTTFNVKLLLTENLDTANSIIEIWRGNNLLYSKKLIELPIEVLAAQTYSVTNPKNYPDLSYLFHLYYDNGQLFADRDFEFKYDIIPDEYVPEVVATQFPYKGEVVNFLNQVAATFEFDPRRDNTNFTKGKISIKAPYASDGQKVIFYDSQSKQLLTIFVSESSFCNDDGVCSFDKGEDQKTCPNDCKSGLPVQPTQTPPVSEEGESQFNQVILWLLIAGFASVGGWYGWRWWKKKKKAQEPILPTNQGGV